jgi:hypothetical protein
MRVSTPAILPRRHPRQPRAAVPRWASLARIHAPYHDPQPPEGVPRHRPPPQPTPRQHDRRQLPHSQPEQTTGPLADTAGDHAGAGPSQPRSAALPHRRSTNRPWRRQGRTRTQDARTQDTRRPDTRRPDTGHPQTGHRYTRHWTPGHRSTRTRGQGDERRSEHSDILHHTTTKTARWTPDRSTWGPALASRNQCQLGDGDTASATDPPRRRPGTSSAPLHRPGAPRRIALLKRLRVERRANGEASSVMTSARADAGWFGRRQRWRSCRAVD